ncbi:hypothetical protein PSEUDO9AZ_10123 [Pseudomonas sp. 9AZ]|nr:hypothetical protein PSEUDO9AZ_10123 [Pseudomonas sp. 9AZ]
MARSRHLEPSSKPVQLRQRAAVQRFAVAGMLLAISPGNASRRALGRCRYAHDALHTLPRACRSPTGQHAIATRLIPCRRRPSL